MQAWLCDRVHLLRSWSPLQLKHFCLSELSKGSVVYSVLGQEPAQWVLVCWLERHQVEPWLHDPRPQTTWDRKRYSWQAYPLTSQKTIVVACREDPPLFVYQEPACGTLHWTQVPWKSGTPGRPSLQSQLIDMIKFELMNVWVLNGIRLMAWSTSFFAILLMLSAATCLQSSSRACSQLSWMHWRMRCTMRGTPCWIGVHSS